MLAELYLRSRYAKGKAEGLKEGREEGKEKEREQWMRWNQRREEALRESKVFSKPHPGNTESAGK